jgi:hypothetical protein
MYTLAQLPAGTTITTRAWDGTEGYGVVTGQEPQGKNGRDVIDFQDSDGGNRWCYLEQVTGIFSH